MIRAYGPGGEFWGGEQDRWDGSRWRCEGLFGERGSTGEDLLVREALSQPVIEDVDGGRWIPVNADVLHEPVKAFKKEDEQK